MKQQSRTTRLAETYAQTEAGWELQVRNGPEQGRIFVISDMPCLMGRGHDCHIVLRDPEDPPGLSRTHCSLQRKGPQMTLTDHSTNGTWVGDIRLRRGETAIVHAGVELRLGPTLRLRCEILATCPETKLGKPGSNTAGIPEIAPGDFRRVLTALPTLKQAWQRVHLNRGAAGPDGVTVHDFAVSAPQRLEALREQLHRGTYRPLPPRFFAAPKRSGGVRVIAILSVQDRIVQQALHSVLMPSVEAKLPDCSFAYRPGVGAHTALRRVETLLHQGLHWIAETDIAAFFDSISHRLVLEQLSALVPDPFVLSLTAQCLSASAVTPGTGIPQGAATSPLLSNLYLADFDRFLLDGGWNPVRYGDDLICACEERGQAQTALAQAEGFLRSRLQLELKASKTRVVSLDEGFTFLGFHFSKAGRRPGAEAVQRLAEQLQETDPNAAPARTRRWETYYGKVGKEGKGIPMTTNGACADEQVANTEMPYTPLMDVTIEDVPDEDVSVENAQADSANISGKEDVFTNMHAPQMERCDEETITRFLELFTGREDCYARQGQARGRRTFTPCAGPLSGALIARHLAGSDSLASYLIREDGNIRQMVLDIDAVQPPGRPSLLSAEMEEDSAAQRTAREFALALAQTCRAFGIPHLLVDSGRKGRHLWIVFSEPVAPERARRLGRLLARQAGFPVEGARLEIFPRHSEWAGPELGDAVTLPLGVHPVSGRRCLLLDMQGEAVSNITQAIASARSLSEPDMEKIIAMLAQSSRQVALEEGEDVEPAGAGNSEAIRALTDGCSVIRSIVTKAAETGHLRHTHQLILLYTAGHLQEEGARFIHQTVSLCRNYDQTVCQKYIDRLEPNHPPISCRRIREWLEEEGETGWCTCPQGRKSPLELVTAAKAKAIIASQAQAGVVLEQNTTTLPESTGEPNALPAGPTPLPLPKPKRKAAVQEAQPSALDGAEWANIAADMFAEP